MNRIYRLVWNRALRAVQVASELAHGSCRSAGTTRPHSPALRTLAAAIAFGLAAPAAWAASCTINGTTYAVCGTNGATATGQAGGTGGVASGTYANSGGAGGNGSGYAGGSGSGAAGSGGDGGHHGFAGGGSGAGGGGSGGAASYAGGGGGGGGLHDGGNSGGGGGGYGGSYFAGGGGGGGGLGQAYGTSGTTTGSIAGGNGGNGGVGAQGGTGTGGGGGGGAGVLIQAGVPLTNASGNTLRGGSGGQGGDGSPTPFGQYGGGGGGGGGGVLMGASSSLTNNGTITGGNGGNGGNGYSDRHGGNGGSGGTGVYGGSFQLTNAGSIAGGNGGGGGSSNHSGTPGAGGVGVLSAGGSTLINSGTISGGVSGDGTTQADAVEFAGGSNTLTLNAGSVLDGAVDVASGATATITAGASGLNLTGGTHGSNALIVDGATMIDTNGNAFTVSGTVAGSAALTVTNSGTAAGALTLGTVNVGTLDDSVATKLNGNVTTSGGGQTYAGAVTLGADAQLADTTGGNIDFQSTLDGAHNFTASTTGNVTFAGNVGSAAALGSLAITGPNGTTTLDNNVTTSGSQTYGNALQLGSNATLDSTGSNITFDGTVDNFSITPELLIVDAPGGAVTFNGAVGGSPTNGALAGLMTQSSSFTTNALKIGAGGLSITTTGGAITQAGAFTVTGASSFNASGNAITLTNAGNDFIGAVGLYNSGANNVTLSNGSHALTLSSVQVGSGTLNLSGTGITQTGAITQAANAGAATFDAGTGSIALGSTGNSFTGTVNLSGDAIAIAAGGPLTLGTVTATGNLSASSSGAMAITGNASAATATLSASGNTLLTGSLSTSNGTTLSGGTLQVGNGGTGGSLSGNVMDNTGLIFDLSSGTDFTGATAGSGTLTQAGSGTLTLSGNSSAFAGSTTVQTGTLLVGSVAGNGASLGGNVTVDSGATLTGFGSMGTTGSSTMEIQAGGILSPGNGNTLGALTVNGNLQLDQGGLLNVALGTPGATYQSAGTGDSVAVNGNLTLDGATLNISNAGGMGPGLYTVLSYTGTLTQSNGGLSLGTIPAGQSLFLQNLTAQNRINLIDTTGYTVDAWNANGHASATQMGGGSGTWSATSQVWTDAKGVVPNGPMSPAPGFALFGGTAGTVTVDDSAGNVTATGMQFTTNGYTLSGDAITLVASNGVAPIVRVGDGTSNGAGMTATIDSSIAGSGGLTKTDLGTLVLAGNNAYTGGTTISAGTLQIGNGGTSGSIVGNITDHGTLTFDHSDAVGFAGVVSGSGTLTQLGSGTLSLTGANSYTGATTITAGTLALSGSGSIASSSDVIANGTFDISGTSTGASIASLDGNGSVNLGSQTLTVTNAAGTFGGTIGGSGGLTLASGNEILTGANTFTDTTTISAGTLQVGNGGTTGAIAGNVAVNGTLAFDRSDAVTLAGVVSGSGALTQIGSGTLILTGTNTYSGGTTISAGTLQVGNGGTMGAITGNVADNGMLAFDHSDAVSLAGVVSGSGALTQMGSGTLMLTGANTYSGGTTISAGTLQVGNGGTTGAITGNVTDNGTFAFDRSDAVSFAGIVSGSGALVQAGSGTLTLTGANTYTGSTTISAGTLVADSSSLPGAVTDNAALVFDQASSGTFSSTISGNGSVTKAGTGTLILDGNSSGFTGTTNVQEGMLEVGDAGTPSAVLCGNVTVASGGTLRGHGTIGGNVTNNGTVWAGGSIGTLTIQGNYTQTANGVFEVEATPGGQASLLSVGGSASLAGTALVLADTGTWAPRTNYTVLTAAGGLSGQFASASSNLVFLDPVLTYTADAVNLSLQRNDISFASVAQTPNQRATAAAADSLGFGNPVYSALTTLDAATARHTFDQLSGVIYPNTTTALIDDSRYVRDAINRHLLGLNNDGTEGATADGVSAWTSAWGHGGHDDSDGNAAELQANGSGLLLGADLPLGSDARLGAVLGHGQNSIQSNNMGSSAHVLGDHAGLYGSSAFGAFVLRAGAVYSWQDVHSNRAVMFGSYSDWLTSQHDAQTAQAYVEGGYRFNVSAGQQLEPFLNLARVYVHDDPLQEGGGAAALAVAGNSTSVNTATLGLRDTLALDAAGGIHAHASLGWQQAWGDLSPVTSMRFVAGGDNFAIAGMPVARHALTTDFGIDFKLAKNVTMDASYLGQFASGVQDQGARMSLTVTF